MGNKNAVTKDYVEDNGIFADAFNYAIYNGVQKINPSELTAYDSTEIGRWETADGKEQRIELFRDGLKCMTVKRGENAVYVLLGIEDQSDVHYAMPVKNMLYDAVDYHTQIRKTAAQYEAERIRKKKTPALEYEKTTEETEYKPNRGEFLTGFYKKDKLLPIVTLVIYFGMEEWDAPRTLHEMFPDMPSEVLALIPDYRINLIAPNELPDEELDKFHSDLYAVLKFLKYAKDKVKLREVIETDKRIQYLTSDTVRVINTVAGTRIQIEKEEVKTNMCKAIDDMIEDGRQELREELRTVKEEICTAKEEIRTAKEETRSAQEEARSARKKAAKGLEAMVHSLRPFITDFDQLVNAIQKNDVYADVTPEEVRKYYY